MLRRIILGLAIALYVIIAGILLLVVVSMLRFASWPLSGPEVGAILILLIPVGIPVYFLPAILGRRKRNARAIFVLNLLVGWTFLGWVGALIWALIRERTATQPAGR